MISGSDLPKTRVYDVGFKKYSNSPLLRLKIIVAGLLVFVFFNYVFMLFHLF